MTKFLRALKIQQLNQMIGYSAVLALLLGITHQVEAIAQEPDSETYQLDLQIIERQQTESSPSNDADENSPLENSYTLGAGDLVYMDIVNVPDYSREYQVLSDGTLNLPLIGSVSVQGMTINQAANEIATRFARYIRRPVVTLDLRESRPLQIAIVGEVHRPGAYNISLRPDEETSTNTSQSIEPTVTQAIQLAGGITQSADIRNIQVRRPQPHQSDDYWQLDVNLWDLLQAGDLQQDVSLKDGDTVFVPTATNLDYAETATLAAASFSPDNITVNVVGEVEVPGAVEVPPNTPLNQALLAAGGFNDDAARKSVELIRLNPNGTVSRQEIEIDFAQDVSEVDNPALRNNDTIVVRRSGASRVLNVMERVLPPLGGIVNLLRIFTPL
ncbi:MAG: SLBB domain-containing protein [Elainellaceae cyanobacterium]